MQTLRTSLVFLALAGLTSASGCRSIARYGTAPDAGLGASDLDTPPPSDLSDQTLPPAAPWSRITGTQESGFFTAADVVALPKTGGAAIVGQLNGTVDFGGGPLYAGSGTDLAIVVVDANHRHVWSKNFGGSTSALATGVAIDSRGDIVMAGVIDSKTVVGTNILSPQGKDILLIKLASDDGAERWAKLYGGSMDDVPGRLMVAADDSILVTGLFQGSFPRDVLTPLSSAGGNDGLLLRIDGDGSVRWAAQVGSAGADALTCVVDDGKGGFVAGGTFGGKITKPVLSTPPSATWLDALIVRVDQQGNVISARGFGGAAQEGVSALAVDDQQQLWATGSFGATFDADSQTFTYTGSGAAMYLVLVDDANTLSSVRTFGNQQLNLPTALRFAPKAQELWWVTSLKGPLDLGGPLDPTSSDMLLVDIQPKTQTFLRTHLFDGGEDDYAWSVAETNAGALLVGTQQVWLENGSSQSTAFNVRAKAEALGVASNGKSVFVAGVVEDRTDIGAGHELAPEGPSDGYLASYAIDGGAPLWQVQLGGSGAERAEAVAVDGDLVVVVGSFSGTLTLNGAPSAGGKDIFVAAFDQKTGQLRWVRNFGSPNDDEATGVAINGSSVVVTGTMQGINDFGTGERGDASGFDTFFIAAFERGSNGKTRWAEAYRGVAKDAFARGGGVAVTGTRIAACVTFAGDFSFRQQSHATKGLFDSSNGIVLTWDQDGQEQWATVLSGSGPETCHGASIDADGRVAVVAETNSTDLMVGDLALNASLAIVLDAVVGTFDKTGKAIYAQRFGTNDGNDRALGVSFQAPGQLVVGGRFASPSLVLGATSTLTRLGASSGWVAAIDVETQQVLWSQRVDGNASYGSGVAGVAATPRGVVAVGYGAADLLVTRKRALVTLLP